MLGAKVGKHGIRKMTLQQLCRPSLPLLEEWLQGVRPVILS